MNRPHPDPTSVPLGVYIHIPYCTKRCPYCDFNVHVRRGKLPQEGYLHALERELEGWAPWVRGRPVETVYFGGGTPSLFNADFYAAFLTSLDRQIGLAGTAEINLEANPSPTDYKGLPALRASGINRLSIGIQSLNDTALEGLGRLHSAQEAKASVEAARSAGFTNLNVDLMFGLPKQTREALLADVEGILSMAPDHVSTYQLTLEPGTAFGAAPPPLPDAEAQEEIESTLMEQLAQAGFRRYEVSNHTRPGYACRHNLNYWTYGDYLGLGAGAHGKCTVEDGIIRTRNVASPETYMARAHNSGGASKETQRLEAEDCVVEFALNALRLSSGVPTTLFTERTGLPASYLTPGRREAEAWGLLHEDPTRFQATVKGWRYLDSLLALFA